MNMEGRYVDSWVMPVPKEQLAAYRKFAKTMGDLCKEHGALEYVDCLADDARPGKVTSYPQAVKLEDDEQVALSWAVYKSREDRDRANEAIMNDPRMKEMGPEDLPFDGKRVFNGGFRVTAAM